MAKNKNKKHHVSILYDLQDKNKKALKRAKKADIKARSGHAGEEDVENNITSFSGITSSIWTHTITSMLISIIIFFVLWFVYPNGSVFDSLFLSLGATMTMMIMMTMTTTMTVGVGVIAIVLLRQWRENEDMLVERGAEDTSISTTLD
jgi:Flp pilus assembly protein TadB